MSDTVEPTSQRHIDANSASIRSIESNSITNNETMTTGGLNVTGNATVSGGLSVNGDTEIFGYLKATGGISFNDVALVRDNGDFVVNGTLTCTNGAIFGNGTTIATDTFEDNGRTTTEGVISANNIRASNRLFVGDSSFEVDSNKRHLRADTFAAYLYKLECSILRAATGHIVKLTDVEEAEIQKLSITGRAEVEQMFAKEIQVESFTAISEFYTKGLLVDGNAKITGGMTISGAGVRQGALVVDNLPAIFNKGIFVYSKEGAVVQTLSVVGTTDETGDATSETLQNKYAISTAIGVRSKFQGDVLVSQADLAVQDGKILAEEIDVAPLGTIVTNANTLQLLQNGNGWDAYVENHIIPANEEEVEEEEETETSGAVTPDQIKARGAAPYVGKAVDITSPKQVAERDRALAKRKALAKQAREISLKTVTQAFKVLSENATYRIDAGGNILTKNAIFENLRTSRMTVNDLSADSIHVNNLTMENVSVDGVVSAKDGLSIGTPRTDTEPATGTSELFGELYNYANITNKDEAKITFTDQSGAEFKQNTTLKVGDKANLIVDEGAEASFNGVTEINLNNLILSDPHSGRKYKFVVREAVGEEGDDEGDMLLEVVEHKEAAADEPAGTTTLAATRRRTSLRADLEEFQAKLKRI